MRQVDAFIKYVLGIDPSTRKQMSYRRLFGDGGGNTGTGDANIHLLIWLNSCPLNSTAVERLLDSTDANRFCERVASYARGIVTENLPIAINKCGCSECGPSLSDIVELPIPDRARKDPFVIQEENVHELNLPNLHYYNVIVFDSIPTKLLARLGPCTIGQRSRKAGHQGI
ncbi:hypothetical protein GQ600_26341 [Phytophthora cactorum]|nr:hypothetical protein GQ600_26341 [Phytophthora cactorum]